MAVSNSSHGTGHAKPLPVTLDLNQPGRLRVGHLLTLFGISHSSLYKGLALQKDIFKEALKIISW